MDTLAAITLGAAGLLSLALIWIVEGLFKRQAPFGEAVDYLIGLIVGVGVAALDYFVLIPLFFKKQWIIAAGAVAEGVIAAWFILWIIRLIVRPPFKTTDEA